MLAFPLLARYAPTLTKPCVPCATTLIRGDRATAEVYLMRLLVARGMMGGWVFDNLMCLSSLASPKQRLLLFQILTNSLPTTRRFRFRADVDVQACPFCHASEYSIDHFCQCPRLHQLAELITRTTPRPFGWTCQSALMQRPLDGEQLQSLAALWHAFARTR